MTDTNDPIVALGRQIAELEARYQELDEKETQASLADDKSTDTAYLKAALGDVHLRLCTLREALSCFEARSLAAALIQVGHAKGLVCDLTEDDEVIAKSARSQMERLLMSAIRCIEREIGTGLDEMGLGVMRASSLDPWTPVEDRLAAIKATCEHKAV